MFNFFGQLLLIWKLGRVAYIAMEKRIMNPMTAIVTEQVASHKASVMASVQRGYTEKSVMTMATTVRISREVKMRFRIGSGKDKYLLLSPSLSGTATLNSI